MTSLKLKGYTFKELFQPDKLHQLDGEFLAVLQQKDASLHGQLLAYRSQTQAFSAVEISELLLACAPYVEQFIAELFGIETALAVSQLKTLSNDPIFIFKKWYVLREAKRRLLKADTLPTLAQLDEWLKEQLRHRGFTASLTDNNADVELAIAKLGVEYLENTESCAENINQLINWCVRVMTDPLGQQWVSHWPSFHLPNKLDYQNLVPLMAVPQDEASRLEGPPPYRHRDGFGLTDPRMTLRQALDEVHYCVYCHEHDGDFCSKGFPEKKGDPSGKFKVNPLGTTLTGCPVEEKISEMHVLKKAGHTIAALAMIMVDNPMCPVTGHRICNDCMKACIYQKQEPVNIPQTETRSLIDVLHLPWGVEIYDLLTRWNPLRRDQYAAKPYNGLKVLIMGMGPAGFTLAHHLLMEGFAVVGTDGLKIEPLPQEYLEQPIYSYDDIKENLDERIMTGFGGVAEYGITVRWDKNFLKLIYISLARRPHFQVFGGVRFGGTLKVEDAWQLGFNHLAIAVGAGLPKELAIPGSLAPGMRQANDFLMALQLTGAAKEASLANLQVRLPAVVIGGGLTGVDTATEVQAYYIAQVEKTLARYELLAETWGETRIREHFDEASLNILNEFLAHGRAVKAERERAQAANTSPDFLPLLRQWGGVTIAYRRLLRESPAYKRNHEEVAKAFEEGIFYAEGLEPVAARLDKYNQVEALVGRSLISATEEEKILPARSIFVATGARPNIAYEYEHRGTFLRDGSEYRTYEDENGELVYVPPDGHCKVKEFGAFTSYAIEDYRVTFLGDTHPVFHGSVVNAVASGKRTYPKILNALGESIHGVGDPYEYQQFSAAMKDAFTATVTKIKRHTSNAVEIKIRAPQASKNFLPGHFYRLQNFETLAPIINGTRLQTEAIALIGAGVSEQQNEITFMVIEQGTSSRLVATFKEGQPVSLMGPTGVRTRIPKDKENVLIMGGPLSAAQIRSVGTAMRAAGNHVIYAAYFQSADELYGQTELENAADKIIWVTQTGAPIKPQRQQDVSVTADLITALLRYNRGELSLNSESPEIHLADIDRVIIVGTHSLLKEMQHAMQTQLKNEFTKNPEILASIYGPMQCMMKGVCAQCLQWQIDPVTGQRTKAVFCCSWQEQPLHMVDLQNLAERLSQNYMQEILSNLWLDYLFAYHKIERV